MGLRLSGIQLFARVPTLIKDLDRRLEHAHTVWVYAVFTAR
jgi:hypothetical protein